MDRLIIKKSTKLKGTISINGSKNSALPIIAATLLSNKDCYLENIPNVSDITTMLTLLNNLGVSNKKIFSNIRINASRLNNHKADYDLVRKMRASILVLGPLLSRTGKAIVSLPGGCAIGTRPIDLHLYGMEKLGAKISIENGYVLAIANKGLTGSTIELPTISVGATENIILAATLARGQTYLKNAAIEPEIQDLCNCLNKMGAKIQGVGTNSLEITGVDILGSVNHKVIPDRIVIGTFIIAALITKGQLKITKVIPQHLETPLKILKKMGADINIEKDIITVDGKKSNLKPIDITTAAYPGFPTDLQAQFMSLLITVAGKSSIKENIFENRFMHVNELIRLGAKIEVKKDKSYIEGVKKLVGASVMASDLRASVSLVLAGLAAEGQTKISRIYHLDRGYEKIEDILNQCGAKIQRIK